MSARDDLRAAESAEAAFWREQEAGNTCRDRGGYYHEGFVDGYKAALAEHPAPEPPSECDGSFMCDATRHEHGCYADEAGFCNHPEDSELPSGGEVTADELGRVIRDAGISGVRGDHVGPFDLARADAILARFDVRRRP